MIPGGAKGVAFFELLYTYGGANVGQIVFESRAKNLVIPRAFLRIAFPSIVADPVQAHHSHPTGPFGVLRRGHSAFASRNGFGCVERKTGNITDRSNRFATV